MIKKTSELVPGDYARHHKQPNFNRVVSITPPVEGSAYWRVDFKDSVGNWYAESNWFIEDQPAQQPLTLTNEQLESVIIQGLSNLVVFATNLDKQEPTDQADFEWGIRYLQNVIMARLMWRQMKESQNNSDSLTVE